MTMSEPSPQVKMLAFLLFGFTFLFYLSLILYPIVGIAWLCSHPK
jgi:hypothetical protein